MFKRMISAGQCEQRAQGGREVFPGRRRREGGGLLRLLRLQLRPLLRVRAPRGLGARPPLHEQGRHRPRGLLPGH